MKVDESKLIWVNGLNICRGTHPKMPNHDGHSIGRAYHLTEDGEKTICNLKVDGLMEKFEFVIKKCKVCFK